MKKENDNGNTVAETPRQMGEVDPGTGNVEDTASGETRTRRIPVNFEGEGREARPADDTNHAEPEGKPAAERADKKVRRSGRAKLSPQAVAHLRGRILKGASSVGFIDDPAAQNPAMDSYNRGYELGYADGYEKAEEDFDSAYRLHVEKSAAVTAKQFNGWQILGIAAPALLIGVVMGIIL